MTRGPGPYDPQPRPPSPNPDPVLPGHTPTGLPRRQQTEIPASDPCQSPTGTMTNPDPAPSQPTGPTA